MNGASLKEWAALVALLTKYKRPSRPLTNIEVAEDVTIIRDFAKRLARLADLGAERELSAGEVGSATKIEELFRNFLASRYEGVELLVQPEPDKRLVQGDVYAVRLVCRDGETNIGSAADGWGVA